VRPGRRAVRQWSHRACHELRAPILALFGEAGVAHEIVTCPGAPHGFFDSDQEEQEAACAAWQRVLVFLNR
jgi:dienelactone hydrolase